VLAPNAAFLDRLPATERTRRVALVIGNANYEMRDWVLPNPAKDAAGVARLLQSVGFEVHLVRDGTAQTISGCAAKASASPAGLAIVYYSGHGLQREFSNYLVATDLKSLDASSAGLVALDGLIGRLRASSKTVMVFLDACRNNPMANNGPAGLAPEQAVPRSLKARNSATGSAVPMVPDGVTLNGGEFFIAFATSPNSVASDGTGDLSPFTRAFLNHATTPGWSITRVLAEVSKTVGEATDWAQTPWTRSSLTSQVFLNGGVDPAEAKRASQLKAKLSRERLALGDRKGAIVEALRALPDPLQDADMAAYAEAHEALYRAFRSRSLQLPVTGTVHPVYSRDGKRVATVSAELGSGSRKEALKLWNVVSGEFIAELLPMARSGTDSSTLLPAAFSGDSRLIAHIDPVEGRPVVWDAATGTRVVDLPKIPGLSLPLITMPRVAFTSTGRFLLISGTISGVHVYDVSGKRLFSSFKTGSGTMAASISPDETYIVTAVATGSSSGGEFKSIRADAFDIASKKALWSREVREASWGAYGAFFSDDGKRIGLTSSSDGVIILDVASGQSRRIKVPRVGTSGLSFSPDGSKIAVTPEDGSSSQPVIRDVANGEPVVLPFTNAAILDTVHSRSGEEVGTPWLPDSGDIWRTSVTGPTLLNAAKAELSSSELADLSRDRVRFR